MRKSKRAKFTLPSSPRSCAAAASSSMYRIMSSIHFLRRRATSLVCWFIGSSVEQMRRRMRQCLPYLPNAIVS
ncbi:hypothetical protein ERO13_D09G138401v2 [Gossypium hirsutum]|nr:hypothetical protein ERO13_D09G138401v2 [Gossypium hirsutum]